MNREIIFRGKPVDKSFHDEWVYGFYLQDLDNGEVKDFIFNCPSMVEVISETIGQFVGLHNAGEKDIYEGDIIAINTWYDCLVPLDYEYRYDDEIGQAFYVVKWDERRCEFYLEYVRHTKMKPHCLVMKIHSGIWRVRP